MSYSSGTFSSSTDLLQKLVAWLVSIGWTQDYSAAVGSEGGWKAHLHLGSQYVHLRAVQSSSDTTDLWEYGIWSNWPCLLCYVGTGYTAGAWESQPGAPVGYGQSYVVGSGINLPGPNGAGKAYHFLADEAGDHVRVVVERQEGSFGYLMWGSSLSKVGSWTGGQYLLGGTDGNMAGSFDGVGSYQTSAYLPGAYQCSAYGGASGYVRANVDAFTGKWAALTDGTQNASHGYTGKRLGSLVKGYADVPVALPEYTEELQTRLVSGLNSQAVFLPALLFVERNAGGWSPLGAVPGLVYSNAAGNGFVVGQAYPLGSDSYMLFPGFALRRVS